MLMAVFCAPTIAQETLTPDSIPQQVLEQAQQSGSTQFCQIIVQSNGTMAPNVGVTKMSSMGVMGESARADIITSDNSFFVSVDNPLGFSIAPNGGNNEVTFQAYMSANGKTSFGQTPGDNRMKLNSGLTAIELNLEATKQAGAFPTGHYSVELTLRCE